MAKHPDEDLFADTTMTFGEHLDELRVALGKAVLALLVGFIAGLFVANDVVSWIQTPLTKALEQYYVDKAKADLKDELEAQGKEPSETVNKFIDKHHFVYEKLYVELGEVSRIGRLAGKQPTGEQPDGSAPTAGKSPPRGIRVIDDALEPRPSTLVLTRVWRPIETVVQALSAHEAFMIWLKAAFVSGLILASPYMFWKIWEFVAAGLYPHEKRFVHIYLPFSLLLFWAGAATAFFFVFQYVLKFLFSFNRGMNIDPDPRISEWLSFVLILPLGFGIAYQLPLIMLFLHRIGIFSIKAYLDKWRVAILIIFVASMLLTPADPVSMLLMAMPLTCLYFLGIGLCKWMPRHKSPFSEGYEP